MRIGIDIDGVLTDIEKFQLERGTKYFGNVINKYGYEIRNIFNCGKSKENEFWLKNLDYYKTKPREGASEFTNYLHDNGIEVFIISSRNILLQKYTNHWLRTNNIYFDRVIYTSDKLKTVKENIIDIMIEDSPKNILQLSEFIPIICMKALYNEIIEGDNVKMVSSIEEIYDYVDAFLSNKITKK